MSTGVDNLAALVEERIGGRLDGATYDPFTDRFLFVQQRDINDDNNDRGLLTVVDRGSASVIGTLHLRGVGVAGGIAVGNDGNLYACNHFEDAPGTPNPGNTEGYIRMFTRADFEAALLGVPQDPGDCTQVGGDPLELCAAYLLDAPTDGPYLDNLFTVPGDSLIGYYNVPPGQAVAQFAFHDYYSLTLTDQGGTLVDFSILQGRSDIPGLLFLANDKDGNPVDPFPRKTDGGEAVTDGGHFLVCSAYLDNSPDPDGVCKMFATACTDDRDCYERVPGTVCDLTAVNPYCYLPERARVDRFVLDLGTTFPIELDVMANDSVGDGVCYGDDTGVVSVDPSGLSLLGGTVAVSSSGNAGGVLRRQQRRQPR